MTSKKNVLVLGSTGMLGHQVVNYLKGFDDFKIDDIAFRNKLRKNSIILDAMDKSALERVVVKLKPDYIINCIGILINGSQNKERAIYLNAYFPHQLKRIAKNINSKLIHISTDCVFSGLKGQYTEVDPRDGQDVYSQTKILGEVIDDTNLTLRTSIIGPELKSDGDGLFHWFMNQTENISGYKKNIWSGVTTIELAKAIKCSIDNHIVGLHHVTNNSSISKYNLLKLFQKYTQKKIKIKPIIGKNINKSFLDTKKVINHDIPSYEIMVREMIQGVKSNPSLYPYEEIK